MKIGFTVLAFGIAAVFISQSAVSQDIATSHQVVFYNLTVKKCLGGDCHKPYTVDLENVHVVQGKFKGVNDQLKATYEPETFLITAFDKRTGRKLYETVVPNPVEVKVEFDGHSHHAGEPAGLTHQVIELPEGTVAVRIPFGPDECTVHVSYIKTADEVIDLATF
jgi:hypothetical protein